MAVVLILLSACVPQVPADLPRISGPETAGVVERILVSAAPTALAQTPVCSGAKLATSLKSSSKGGYAPPGGYLVGPGDNLKFNIFGEARMTDITARVDDAVYLSRPGRLRGDLTKMWGWDLCQSFMACIGVRLPRSDCGNCTL